MGLSTDCKVLVGERQITRVRLKCVEKHYSVYTK